jgi:hypothetical protein
MNSYHPRWSIIGLHPSGSTFWSPWKADAPNLLLKMTTKPQNLTSIGPSNLVGWMPETQGRGTLTLLTSCLATIMLCTWMVIHPRISKRKNHRLLHKLVLWAKTIIAPEFIAVEAAQEWIQARKVAKEASITTNGELGVVQALYIGRITRSGDYLSMS